MGFCVDAYVRFGVDLGEDYEAPEDSWPQDDKEGFPDWPANVELERTGHYDGPGWVLVITAPGYKDMPSVEWSEVASVDGFLKVLNDNRDAWQDKLDLALDQMKLPRCRGQVLLFTHCG